MSLKTTVIAAVVLAALAAYIYKYEREPVDTDGDSEREEVFDFEAEKIQDIQIRRPGGDGLQLRKDGESWKIVQPVSAPASETEADSLTRNIATLERERVVVEGDEVNLSEFGLAEPKLEVQFTTEGAEGPTTLLLGDKTPTGTNLYAKLASEKRIFVIPSYLESNFDKEAWDLRDRTILHFERDEVEKVVLRRPDGELVLARAAEDRWNVATPSFCRADRYRASGLVSQLETGKMEEIVSEQGGDLSEYGLDRPRYEVEIQLRGGKTATLLVGGEKDGRYYARNPDRSLVYLVGSSLVDEIKKDASGYRSKRLFDYSTYQVNKFQIEPAGEAARTYQKVEEEEEDQWKQIAPDSSRELDRTKVEDLLYKMNGTDAEDFADDAPSTLEPYDLDSPAFTITVWSKEGASVEELAVGKPEGEWVYARRKGDEPVMKLPASKWEEIEKLMSFEETEKETGERDEEK
ncbi:MAG: DUF4340 domain-containing protein [Acidobacteriota bacterium]